MNESLRPKLFTQTMPENGIFESKINKKKSADISGKKNKKLVQSMIHNIIPQKVKPIGDGQKLKQTISQAKKDFEAKMKEEDNQVRDRWRKSQGSLDQGLRGRKGMSKKKTGQSRFQAKSSNRVVIKKKPVRKVRQTKVAFWILFVFGIGNTYYYFVLKCIMFMIYYQKKITVP